MAADQRRSTDEPGQPGQPGRGFAARAWRVEQRENAVDARELAADERDRAADERDEAADERDRAADQRDEVADQRDQAADRRELIADERDRMVYERELWGDQDNKRRPPEANPVDDALAVSDARERTLATLKRARTRLADSRVTLNRSEAMLAEVLAQRMRRETQREEVEVDTNEDDPTQ